MFSKVTTLILTLSLLTCVACTKSSGKGDGSGEMYDEDLALANQERYGEGSIPKAEADGMFKDIHFNYDSSQVKQSDYPIVKAAAKYLKSNPSVQSELEGHCDKRGTSEYNMALGERRAKAVATLLVSFGAPASQISTISYGEEIPIDPSDNESAYAKNRRVHFTIYDKQK